MAISIDDRQLVESYQAGDADAFADLVRAHGGSLLGHAIRRLNDRSAAEDAVQETFVRAYRALPRFDGDYRVGPWLHRILENVCADEGNRRRRESEKFDRFAADPYAVDTTPGVESELGLDFDDTDLAAALASLSPAYREALSLRFVDELSYDEVAKVAGVSEPNARARVSRARNAARSALRGVAAIPAFLIPALRKSEGVAVAAGHGHAAPAFAPATEAAMAAAPSAVPMLTKAMLGLTVVASVAVPNSSADLVERSRVVGAVDASLMVQEPVVAPVEATAPAPVVAAPAPLLEVDPSLVVAGVDPNVVDPELVPPVDPVPLPAPAPVAEVSDGEASPEPAPAIPAPVVGSDGLLTVSNLTVSAAGPRVDLAGDAVVTIDGTAYAGRISGRLAFTDDEATGTRRYSGTVTLALEGGNTIDLRLQIQAVAGSGQSDLALAEVTSFGLSGQFRATGGDTAVLVDSGLAAGTLDTAAGTLTLALTA